jgi:hypothetical protein
MDTYHYINFTADSRKVLVVDKVTLGASNSVFPNFKVTFYSCVTDAK